MTRFHLKTLLSVLLILGLSGCAHQRLTDNANSYVQEGRYELALQEYDRALALKPGNRDNQAGRDIAYRELSLWLDQLEQEAESAYNSQESGKALILYAKLFQLRKTPHFRERYQTLLHRVSQAQLLRLGLIYDADQLGRTFDSSIRGLENIDAASDGQLLSLKVGNYKQKTTFDEKMFSTQYLASIETLANPDYLHLQEKLHFGRDRLRQTKRDIKGLNARLTKLERKEVMSRQKLQMLESSLGNIDPESSRFRKVQKSIDETQYSLDKVQGKIEVSEHDLEESRDALHHIKHRQQDRLERLAFIPPTIEQEVFADYEYSVGYITQTMKADLKIVGQGKAVEQTAVFVNTDSEHPAHPTIDLEEKQAFTISTEKMRRGADGEAETLARDYLEAVVETHRQRRLNQAVNANKPARRFEYWVAYLLAGDQSPDRQIENNVRRHLELEYGIVGEFPIAQLITLYSDS